MAYKKDPRENIIDLDNHAVWEQDNRVEDRFVWNAAVLDLCDMSPEEYMKNPIIDAINGSGGQSLDEIKEAINDLGDRVIENDDENTDRIIEAIKSTSGETGETQVVFYYASVNALVNDSDLTLNDFVVNVATVNKDMFFNYTLGDPTPENWEKFENYEIDETELREVSYNKYYLLLPNAYGTTKKFVISENGVVDVTNEFNVVSSSIKEGYTLIKSDDVDHFNIDYPTEKNIHITYKIKILS